MEEACEYKCEIKRDCSNDKVFEPTLVKKIKRDSEITEVTEDKRFVHSPEELAGSFTTEPKKFIDLVEANYLPHFREIENVLKATDGLSICDVILNEYRDDSMALVGINIGIRSMMVANENQHLDGYLFRGKNDLI
ncbi:hypothetical protein EVAR_73696_1 [Eumeta japonica]|uniref:Uncharacterized protein n=1 Tax=Eumeta variegata TaxID=151549 RepID=A0A4C1SE83_EUMVA|nr:hypothetical protein EVAR_73696_1 [Eumeta japonica]